VPGPDEQQRREKALDRAIGRRLRKASAGVARADLASALRVDAQTIAAYEEGQRHIPAEHMLILAKLLDVTLSYFYETAADDPAGAG
jgi:transcriptional regulator with XRE-family HTH domain